MRKPTELELLVDEAAYQALMKTSPTLCSAIRDLLDQKQTPAQIERAVRRNPISDLVRGAAEYMRRHPQA